MNNKTLFLLDNLMKKNPSAWELIMNMDRLTPELDYEDQALFKEAVIKMTQWKKNMGASWSQEMEEMLTEQVRLSVDRLKSRGQRE